MKIFRMNLWSCLFLAAVVWINNFEVDALNPGFKARITTNGLNYANSVAIEALKTNVQKAKIPDQSGEASGFKYSISNIHVTQFNPPSSDISLVPGKGLTWKASNAYIAIHGDFHYKKWFISDGGSFDAKLSGVSFGLELDIDANSEGRPDIAAKGCSSSFGDVDFKFHGGMSWLYNIFRENVANVIKDSLNGQLCKMINKEVNEDGAKKLADIKVTTKLAKKFLLDYRLSANPTFQSDYFETYHKGEIYWLTNPNTECPFSAPTMPDQTDNKNMLYLWISDYMFDSIGYAAQKHGFLVRNLTQNDLPASSRGVLNTTCSGFIPKCVGSLIPEIGQKYPHMAVELRMKSTEVPRMTVSASGVSLNATGTIDMYATKPGSSDTPFLLSLGAIGMTNVNISIQNELVYAQIKNMKIKLSVIKSAVGKISGSFLDFLVKEALNTVLIPQLNDLGKKGFPLPVTGEIKFTNTKLSFAKDTILIGTDLKYTPKTSAPIKDTSGPLKFIPNSAGIALNNKL
ncbi:hypothetical protein ACF0H5_006020 [Mactra antiquata]